MSPYVNVWQKHAFRPTRAVKAHLSGSLLFLDRWGHSTVGDICTGCCSKLFGSEWKEQRAEERAHSPVSEGKQSRSEKIRMGLMKC